MAGDALLVDVCKTIIASPRPLNEIIVETNFSFPSGHVTSTVVLFGVFTYLAWKHWKTTKTKILTGAFYVLVTAIVSFDRIYLNVHWLSDVVGGVFLGVFWLSFCIYLFNRLIVAGRVKRFIGQH
jgi:undecaprenyl-diphosphatase